MRRLLLLLLVGLLPSSIRVTPDDPPPIDRVEEDWELVILTTDLSAAGPQITTTMCPGPIEDHPDTNFNLNYREGGSFAAGGLQIEVFDGNETIAKTTARDDALQTDGETITWTQRLSLSGGTVQYQVVSGHSATWGDFGGDELTVTFPTALGDLSAYSPDISLSKSGVGWQSDHVQSMRLMKVRYYSGDTLVSSADVAKAVHPVDFP